MSRIEPKCHGVLRSIAVLALVVASSGVTLANQDLDARTGPGERENLTLAAGIFYGAFAVPVLAIAAGASVIIPEERRGIDLRSSWRVTRGRWASGGADYRFGFVLGLGLFLAVLGRSGSGRRS